MRNGKAVFMIESDNGVLSFIANNILQAPELKPGQRAAIVIRLCYEEERQRAKESYKANVGRPNKSLPDLAEIKITRDTSVELAKKAGIGRSNMTYLIAVYRNRTDLFELVFDCNYTINNDYTQKTATDRPQQ